MWILQKDETVRNEQRTNGSIWTQPTRVKWCTLGCQNLLFHQPQPHEHDYCGCMLLRLISVVEEPYFEQFSKTYFGQVGDYADSFYNRCKTLDMKYTKLEFKNSQNFRYEIGCWAFWISKRSLWWPNLPTFYKREWATQPHLLAGSQRPRSCVCLFWLNNSETL